MRVQVAVAVALLGLSGLAIWLWPRRVVSNHAAAPDPVPIETAPARAKPTSHPPSVVEPAPSAVLDEPALMTELRRIASGDPERAIALARDGNRRFPDSADAPERTSVLIHALATRGLSSEARGEAEQMVNHYPDSHWVREIELFTGAHRHRNAHLNDAGQLEFY